MKIKLFDYSGKLKSEVEFKFEQEVGEVNNDLFAQYIRVVGINSRQGTSKVKTRSEVRGGGKKPHKQKGTGRARAGSSRSPLWRGGGVIHGPTPVNYRASINKKMTQNVLVKAVGLRLKDSQLLAFDYPTSKEKVSTKKAGEFLDAAKIEGKVLVIHNNNNDIYKSFRNIKNVDVISVSNVSAFQFLSNDMVVVESGALKGLEERVAK